jgi:ankyrin repeat protein
LQLLCLNTKILVVEFLEMNSVCTLEENCGTRFLQVCQQLLEAIKSREVERVKILYKCTDERCTTPDISRYTPLQYATRKGYAEVVRVLLEGGANAERAYVNLWTALHYAANMGHLDVCRVLLDWGAKVDPVDDLKNTPLHRAARNGSLSVVELLVQKGADVSLTNYDDQTAKEVARDNGRTDVVDWLDSVSSG